MKPFHLIWSERAAADLRRIKSIISHDKPDAAGRFIKNIKLKTERLRKFPKSGRIVPELSRQEVREVIVGSYRIVYKISKNAIFVLTVFHSHQVLRVI